MFLLIAVLSSFAFSQTQWTSVTTGMTGDIWGIDFVNASTVWICSSVGEVKRSTDGGATWLAAGNAGDGAYSIAALSATTAVVALGPSSGSGSIKRTTDGGTTWTQVYTATGAWFNFVDNWSATELWALSDPIGGNFHIVVSTDAGATWALAPNLPPAPAANVFGANNSWYQVGSTFWFGTGGSGSTLANRVYKSTNGPNGPWTFATTTAQYVGSVAFSSGTGAGVCGFWQANNTINRSADGGATWTAQSNTMALTRGLEYVRGTSYVWAATSTGIYSSSDNGATWTANTIPPVTGGLNFIRFFQDANVGFAGGAAGLLLKSNLNPVLPVELVSFSATQQGSVINLSWATASEINNSGFEIQRKIYNGDKVSEWTAIGFKAGKGTTTERQEYTFSDDISGVTMDKAAYRLKQMDFGGQYEYSDEIIVENIIPLNLKVMQNYPNPFNPSTVISFDLNSEYFVSVKVYNSLGQQVADLLNEVRSAGNHEVLFNADNLSSGSYYAVIRIGDQAPQTLKMSLMK